MRTVQLGRDASTQVSHENKVDTAMKDADIKYSVKEKAGLEKSVRGEFSDCSCLSLSSYSFTVLENYVKIAYADGC